MRIVEHLSKCTDPKVIGGDFNLMPDTESVGLFEKSGYKNLIKDFDIKTTRSSLNSGKYPEGDIQYFADYAFVSPEVKVKDFKVPQVEISDHLPLILEFEI